MLSPKFCSFSVASALLAASLPSAMGQLAGPLDFETGTQLSGNFRATVNGSTASQASDGANGFISVNGGTGTTPWIGIYDTTPGDSTDVSQTFGGPIKVHFDISAANSNASFGIFLFDDANRNGNNILALLNVDTTVGGTGTEQIRFWKDTSITTSAVSNPYSTSQFTGTNGSANAGTSSWISDVTASSAMSIDTDAPFTFYSLDFIYDPSAMTLTVATAAFSATLAIPAADIINNPGVALRINDSAVNDPNTQKVDNFLVAVPEPGSAAVVALASLALAMTRRRQGAESRS
jgi:hypothetical protein